MKYLEKLLDPYVLAEFLENYWTQKAIHIQSNTPKRFQSFFSWDDLNNLLNYHGLLEPDLHFSLDGKSLPETNSPEEWNRYLRRGATLIVNGIHRRVPAISQLAAQLRQDFGYRTHVNLYFSPTAQQGFNCHYDNHDVLVLQLEGEKEWFIFGETEPCPTLRHSDSLSPPNESPYLQCTLKAGEVLYVPRGHWHYAIAALDTPSLHLTVGIDCQTGLDWLQWLAQEAQKLKPWRESIPCIQGEDRTVAKQHLQKLQQHLAQLLMEPEMIQGYLDSLTVRHQPPIQVNLPSQLGKNLFENIFETRYTWSPLHAIHVNSVSEEECQMRVGEKQVTLKHISPNFIRFLTQQNTFTLLDVAEWEPEMDLEGDIVPLITCLVTEGILLVQ